MIKSFNFKSIFKSFNKNTNVDDISAYILLNLYGKVKVGGQVEIIVYQPVAVMQF